MKDLKRLVKAWPESGLTQQEFCKKHKLSYNKFQYLYRRKAQRLEHEKAGNEGFIELSPAVLKTGECRFTIYFPTGARIECQGIPDVTFLKALLMPLLPFTVAFDIFCEGAGQIYAMGSMG